MMESRFVIERWTTASRFAAWGAMATCLALALAPTLLSSGSVDRLTALFVYVVIAAMWNALAGYAGLVSVGQQMFFGLGAYFTIRLTDFGIDPFVATALAAFVTAVCAWVVSLFMLHLRGGEFAIGMWVLASLTHLLVNLDRLIQGETGASLISMNAYNTTVRRIMVYEFALVGSLALLGLLVLLLRGRTGGAIQAIRDDEVAAASLGVSVLKTKRWLFVLAGLGVGFAGAIWLCSAITFQPKTYFSVQWTAYMIFMVLVGGIGRFEGAILGAVIFFVMETWFGASGTWYLIGLGLVAVLCSLFFSKGIWGAIEERFDVSLLPVGHRLKLAPPLQAPTSGRRGQ